MDMNCRWLEHVFSSKLTTSVSWKSVVYMSYPHTDTREENISVTMCDRATFSYSNRRLNIYDYL